MANRHMKRCFTSYALGKCKLRQQCDITTHVSQGSKSRTLTALNAGDDVEPQVSWIAVGCKMIPPLWKIDSFAFSSETKHIHHVIQQLCSLVFTPGIKICVYTKPAQ